MKLPLLHPILVGLFVLAGNVASTAQSVSITADPSAVNVNGCTSPPVSFSAVMESTATATAFNFNGGALPPGWSSSPYTVSASTCTGQNSPDGTPYFWATDLVGGIRYVQTNSLDVSLGGQISFYIRYGNNEAGPCEQPDLPEEEVYLQYSTNGGASWVTMYDSWDINSSGSLPWYNWYLMDLAIPVGAQSANTIFRWYQPQNSCTTCDNWGLETVSVTVNLPLVTIVDYAWNFGDGGPIQNGQSVTNTFPNVQGSNTYAVTVTATSSTGTTYTASVNYPVSIVDNTNPIIECPNNIVATTGVGNCTATVSYTNPIALDNCPGTNVIRLSGPASGSIISPGVSTVLYRVADAVGNSSTCSFTITVEDQSAPTITTCPPSITVNTCTYVVPTMTGGVAANDPCGLATITQTPSAGVEVGLYHNDRLTVVFTVTDVSGNTSTCSARITINDATPPTAVCKDITVNLSNGLSPHPSMDAFVSTQLTGNQNYSQNVGMAFQVISPILVTKLNAYDDGVNGYAVPVTIGIVRNSDGAVVAGPVNFIGGSDPVSGFYRTKSITPVVLTPGAYTVVYFDPAAGEPIGNSSIGSGYPPVSFQSNGGLISFLGASFGGTSFGLPTTSGGSGLVYHAGNFTYESASELVLVTGDMLNSGSSDDCISNLSFAPAATIFDCSETGTHLITLTVSDAQGNSSTCTSRVTVRDVTAPVITTCPANLTVNDCDDVIPSLTAGVVADDNCGIASITQNPVAGTDFGQSSGESTIITFTVTDESGNTSTCTNTITIIDNVNPQISCSGPISVPADINNCTAVVTFTLPVSTDNCPDLTLTQLTGVASGAAFPLGTTVVAFLAEDEAGNTNTCSFTVEVYDNQAPQALCQDLTVNLSASGLVTVTAAQVNAGSNDNCTGMGALVLSPASTTYSCSNIGDNNLVFVAQDGNGNTASCVATITVRDVTAPTFTCPAPVTMPSCNSLVPNVILGLSANDACGIASIVQSPAPGLDFGTSNGNSVTITVTVTDVNGNVQSCIVPVTISDATPPTFVNCPTEMVMVGNDPSTCSAKINWQVPVAQDDCQLVSLVQAAGPLPGSILPVTCPPSPSVVVYRATDASGNTATCSIQVLVVDTEKPKFDADVLMPNDTVVNCHQIPTNCIFRPLNVCTPLNNNDVNDNCSSPANITLGYNQQSTQNSDPATCGHYNYTLTRTWTATDCSGNTLAHTQVLTVRDTTRPVAICQNITITLNDFGLASITPKQLDGGSTDNCAANANLTFTASKTNFNCADFAVSPVTVVLTATDPCGNFRTCNASVTILQGNGDCTPEYDISGSDPCVCLDNATNLENGQFGEFIQIHALRGQIWTVQSSTGLMTSTSPAPPAAPIAVSNGTALTAGNLDGIDNDGDTIIDEIDEAVYFTLQARHVDAIGYSATFTNGTNSITLSNKCHYPTPYFTNLADPFCISTPAFSIGVAEVNGATGTVENVTINGVPATTFNAAALGEGLHTVAATFNAGAAQNFLQINGVTITGSNSSALQDPGCRQRISKVVEIIGTPTSVSCSDSVQISLDETCVYNIDPSTVLTGNSYGCYDDYYVQIDKTLPLGNGPWLPGILTAADIGQTYGYQLVHILSGNVCMGVLRVEDKLAPALTCPPNITIGCSESTATSNTGNVGVTDCSATTIQVKDFETIFAQCSNPRAQIERQFIVTDAPGNESICSQLITIRSFSLSEVDMPADLTVNCEAVNLNPNAVAPAQTGAPNINGVILGQGGFCSAYVNYTDEAFDICEGSYEIHRTWKVGNTCLPLGAGNPLVHVQRIQVYDLGGPQFDCPVNVTVSTDPTGCCATAALPSMIVSEGCSGIEELQAMVSGFDPLSGNTITFNVAGTLSNFPGNNPWDPDTLAQFNNTQCLPIGTYMVMYTAKDRCDNTSTCSFELIVEDQTAPLAICDEITQVALGIDGSARVAAVSLDNGSLDNCGQVSFKVRRMDLNDCQSNSFVYDEVQFCCDDINTTVPVIIRVYDAPQVGGALTLDGHVGNYNECMVEVLVEDKIRPICTPPANVTVSCEAFDPSLWAYGTATAQDNCCFDQIEETVLYNQFDSLCNRGTITRRWVATDCSGNTNSCQQRVNVTYNQYFFVKFPNDVVVSNCNGTGSYGTPEYFGAQDCELMSVSFTDEIFTSVPDACFKIARTWTVLNWCTYNPNIPCVVVPNPEPSTILNHPTNLTGVTVSAFGNTVVGWAPTLTSLVPGGPQLNFSNYWNANTSCYKYTQVIKILDTTDPIQLSATSPELCGESVNDPTLWNAMYWFDANINSHDLSETSDPIEVTATDACSGANVRFRYLLFLDLNGDGSAETVVNSATATTNTVRFNNIATPNYAGGTPQAFDFRGVPANRKWRFGVETDPAVGNTRTARVTWENDLGENTSPKLPYGKHRILWIIEDGCGNELVQDVDLVAGDCKPPTVVCLNGLSVNLMNVSNGMVSVYASDFLLSAEDNSTPNNYLVYGIRRAGTGTDFPVNPDGTPQTEIVFTCADLGTQLIELWAADVAGNADFCETYVLVQDNIGICNNSAATVAGALQTEEGEGVQDATVELNGVANGLPSINEVFSNVNGGYQFSNALPFGADYSVTPHSDSDPLNGVNTYDLVLISRHILGIEPLSSPYLLIAADVNKSGTVTTFDIVELRKLILGAYPELPNNSSWRFIDANQQFSSPDNPFADIIRENISVAQLQSSTWNDDFVGVKVGDVDHSAIPNNLVYSDDRTSSSLLFDLEDRDVATGEVIEVPFTADQVVSAYQFTLQLNGMKVLDILPGEGMDLGQFAVFNDATGDRVTTAWDQPSGQSVKARFVLRLQAEQSGKLSKLLKVSSSITRAMGFTEREKLEIGLRFNQNGQPALSGVGFELYQNTPNPWVSTTQIGFHLPTDEEEVKLTVYDVTGRVLYSEQKAFERGYHFFNLDKSLVDFVGTLFYRVETVQESAVKTMIKTR